MKEENASFRYLLAVNLDRTTGHEQPRSRLAFGQNPQAKVWRKNLY
jgi:hypothetical protein